MERGLARLFPLLVPPSQLHSKKVKVKLCSRVWFFVTPWAVACQAPPSMGFSRQGHWSGLPFPSPGIFPTQGLNPGLPPCRLTLYPLSHQASFTSYYPFQKRLKSWPRPGQPLPKGSKVENMAGHKKKKKESSKSLWHFWWWTVFSRTLPGFDSSFTTHFRCPFFYWRLTWPVISRKCWTLTILPPTYP